MYVFASGLFRVSFEYPALELDHTGVGSRGAQRAKGFSVHSHPSGLGASAICGHMLSATTAGLHLRDISHLWYFISLDIFYI